MIDIAVALEGPIAVGSDRRAKIVQRPGGSAATQAVWLARFGISVDFVGRVGAADHAAETELLRRAGVEPHLAADPSLETGRLIAIVDPSGERSFLTDRGANDALEAADIPDALIDRADHIHISGYSFFAPSPREAVLRVMRRAARPVSVDPGSAEFLREVGAANFLDWTAGAAMLFPNSEEAAVLAGTDDAEAQGERLCRALSARRDQARRGGLRGLARSASDGASRRRRRAWSIRRAPGMLSWRRSWPRG